METHASGHRAARWLMIGVVLAVLTVAVYSASSEHDLSVAMPVTEPVREHVPHEVSTLLAFVDSATLRGRVGHEFTAAGVRYVAAALGTVATSAGLDIGAELETVREHATRIQRDPRPHERTAQARTAFRTLAGLLEAIQQVRFGTLDPDVANVSRAAWSLSADHRLVEQSDVVQEFFRRAASAIRAMSQELSAPFHPPATSRT